MLVYRACKEKHAKRLDGEGAKLNGGRWNSQGNAVVYCASSRSLAILETLVNVGSVDLIPDDYVMLEIDIPDNLLIEHIRLKELSEGFSKADTRRLGDAWVKACNTAVLIVPSKVVTQENNILINPAHPDSTKIKLKGFDSFKDLDSRLFDLG